MEGHNTLSQLASYDFSVPVNATIIFEERDEEKSTPLKEVKLECSNLKENNDCTASVIDPMLKRNESIAPSLPLIETEPVARSDSNGSNKGLEELKNFLTINNVNIETTNREQLKRKAEEPVLSQKKTFKGNDVRHAENNNNDGNIHQYQHESLSSQDQLTPQEVMSNHNIFNNTEHLNNEIRELSTYIIDLLKAVSEHLIFTLKAYLNYVQVQTNNRSNPNVIENAKNYYLRVKYYFFNLSFCTVTSMIIPQHRNVTFIKSFLEATVEIARKKTFNYTYEQLEPLYLEMIEWAKEKKQYLNNLPLQYASNSNILKAHPNKPPLPLNNSNSENIRKTCQTKKSDKPIRNVRKTYLFSSGPPGKEVSISIERYPDNESHSNYVSSEPSTAPRPHECGGQCRHSTNYGPISQSNNVTNSFHCQPKAHADGRINSTLISHTNNDSGRYLLQNTTNPNTPTSSQRQPPPSYQRTPWMNQLTTPLNYNGYQQMQWGQQLQSQNEMQNQVENSRSSVSRDSGFISPLNFNTSSDSLPNIRIEEERMPKTQFTPLITHVTSLNPNVSHINCGLCQVCGKITKTKCLGCYKSYYCSHECQQHDWISHMVICKSAEAQKTKV